MCVPSIKVPIRKKSWNSYIWISLENYSRTYRIKKHLAMFAYIDHRLKIYFNPHQTFNMFTYDMENPNRVTLRKNLLSFGCGGLFAEEEKESRKWTSGCTYLCIKAALLQHHKKRGITLWMDDIKQFEKKNEKEQETLMQTLRVYSQDISQWNFV